MKKLLVAVFVSLFAMSVYAQTTSAESCEARAVSKDGKPLYGAAKTASIKKCEKEKKASNTNSCEARAVSKDGKPLYGAAKAASIKKCEQGVSAGKSGKK